MVKDIDDLLKENVNLIQEKEELLNRLSEANEVIEGIKKGNIDAVFIANDETANVLVSKTADQAYRRFIENMSEGVVTLHTDGIILYSNSSFAKMVNVPLENLIGTNFRNFIPNEYIGMFERLINENPQNNSKVELTILNFNGNPIHFIVSLNTLLLQDSVALNLVLTDVTEQKRTEKKLITVNENLKSAISERISSENNVVILNNKLEENIKILKDANFELATFAHIASHDLQEPLRKIITYGGILRNEYFNTIDQQGQNYINIMQSASARMRNLINDILQYSALSQNDFLFKPTNLQSIVKEIISDLEIVITEKKANIIIEKDLPVIEADSSQMRQLFQNIITNSLKFINAYSSPQISITYESIRGKEIEQIDEGMYNEMFYKFYIKDNGIGFMPEYINKIFTIFQRLNNNATYPGTGIGLAICKKIVEKHHGYITAESKLNEGAVFTIILPVCQTTYLNMTKNTIVQDISPISV
jgi:PAS domain S-box-containing protein